MQVIARSTLTIYARKHPETKPSLERWCAVAKAARWTSTAEVLMSFASAKGLDGERVRFEVAGGNHRMIVAFRFPQFIAFIKFIGTHEEYDDIDPFTVSQF